MSVTGLKEVLRFWDAKRMSKITARTLNKTAAQGKTASSKGIRNRYTIKASRINKNLRVIRATFTKLSAAIRAQGRTPGLQNFRMKGGNRLKSGKRKDVTVEVIKGKRKTLTGGFITKPKGKDGIFKRIGKERLPIKRLFGPDAQAMMQEAGIDPIEDVVEKKMPSIFRREFDFEMGKK